MRALSIFLVLIALAMPSWGSDQDADLELKAQSIDKKLIAPCCWTASLDQHFSEVSEEMKAEIRDRLSKGQSEEEILSFFEDKYGERVLSQPKANGFNLTVWIFPGLILITGLFLLFGFLKREKKLQTVSEPIAKTDLKDEKYRKQIDQELYRAS